MAGERVRFEDFELDPRAYHLQRFGRSLKLERIPTELLLLLVERRGQLVTREEIIERLWGKNVFLDTDNAINTAIRKIRHTLRDDPEQPRFVQTVTGSGYRFIAPVAEASSRPISAAEIARAQGPVSAPQSRYSLRVVIPLAAVLALIVLGTGYLIRARFSLRSAPAHGRVMLAVLPFENLSNDSDQEYFSDGLTEEAITDLGRLSPERLGVIARTSAMAYKHTSKRASQIGQELGVDYLLEGSVRREGERVRISAQLIRVKDETHVWAQSYDRDMRDFLAVQNELGEAIAGQVQVSLTPEQKLEQTKTRRINPEAYDDYLKGLYFWNRFTPGSLKKSVDLFQQAIEKDPGYAQAYAGLSESYGVLMDWGVLPRAEAYPKSEAAARKAVELDSGNSEAHSALGWQMLLYDRDWSGAEREFRRAIQLNPSNADAHEGFAYYFAVYGRFDESIAEMKKARELDPLSLLANVESAKMLIYARRYDQALQQLHFTLDLDPGFHATHYFLFQVYLAKGMYEEAYQEFLKQYPAGGQFSELMADVRNAHAKSGWKRALQKYLAIRLELRSKGVLLSSWDLALLSAALGNKEQTLDSLQKAADERFGQVIFVKVDPLFDSLRSDPRFQDLVRRLGLPP